MITLKRLRMIKGINQKELAQRLGISEIYVSKLERGETNPSDKLKRKLMEFYKVQDYNAFYTILENTKKSK